MVRNITLLFLILLAFSCDNEATYPAEEDSVFKLLPASNSGVSFKNNITEGLNTNVLMYEYFYNGGGVASGDLNADGREDLYFTSNMEENHLYLNKGELKFKEVAKASGVTGRIGPWKTGVSLVDINADHLLDIYLCYSGNLPDEKKRNQLFINMGNNADGIPMFKDEASAYGLDHPGNSTHAVFFDHDRDNDLDMVLVNHNPKSLPVLDESSTSDLLSKQDSNSGIVFFENPGKGNAFLNKTIELGIQSSSLSYGLAVGVSDINKDGWLDFYVSNDYAIPDYLYINQKGKGFINQINKSLGHFSHFSMGNDIADVNNDGLSDILTLDMLPEDNRRQKLLMAPDNYEKFEFNLKVGFGHQYMRNMLHLGLGNQPVTNIPLFAEVGQQSGISNTDWSWSALLADYNNDGWKDLYVTNGYLRDYTNLDFLKYMGDYVQNNQKNIQRENVLELVNKMPSSDLTNYIFKNQGNGVFKKTTSEWGVDKKSNSNGAVYADLDNDGDLEIIVNNINAPAFIFENKTNQLQKRKHYLGISLFGNGENTFGLGATIKVYAGKSFQYFEQQPHRSYQSSVSPILHIGLDTIEIIDSVVVKWNSGVSQVISRVSIDAMLQLRESDASIQSASISPIAPYFKVDNINFSDVSSLNFNDFKRQTQLVNPLSQFGPILLSEDVNGDGLKDVFVASTALVPSRLYIQTPSGEFVQQNQPNFEKDSRIEAGAALLEDFDADGDLDIYIAAGGYGNFEPGDSVLQDKLFLNDGKGHFTSYSSALPVLNSSSKSCVVKIDLDGDPFPDLFIGSRVNPGAFPQIPKSYILRNIKGKKFEDVSHKYPLVCNTGMVSDAKWYDIDGNGKPELIYLGNWMPIKVMRIDDRGCFDLTANFFSHSPTGLWNKLIIADINKDGRPELVAGNLGNNTQLKTYPEGPLEMFAKDFDQNGSIDPIMTTYVMGKKAPFLTRDELLDQLNVMRSRFTSYESFSRATIENVFTKDELKNVQYSTAETLLTQMFTLNKSGKFELVDIPNEVQRSPVFTINVLDVDEDGFNDLLFCGNIYSARLRLGKMDANFGLLLKGQGGLKFEAVQQATTGLFLKGDVRSALYINDILFLGLHGSSIQTHRKYKK